MWEAFNGLSQAMATLVRNWWENETTISPQMKDIDKLELWLQLSIMELHVFSTKDAGYFGTTSWL
jgi:hypothetical protein